MSSSRSEAHAGADAPGGSAGLERWAIVAGSLLLVAGVLFRGWPAFMVLALFWIENVVIGVFNVVRMLLLGLRIGGVGVAGAAFTSAFFVVHYGFFCLGHALFVVGLFGGAEGRQVTGLASSAFLLAGRVLSDAQGWLMVGLIVATAGLDTRRWWAALRDNAREPQPDEISRTMFAPYPRIVVLHVTLIAGGFLLMALDAPAAAVLLLVAFKLVFDLRGLHAARRESGVLAAGGAGRGWVWKD